MVNKKGTELSLNFIIIAAIVLVVLIVAILFFTGGASKLIGEQKQVQVMSEQERGLALASCKFACTMKDESKYNSPGFSESVVKAKLTDCEDFLELESYTTECLSECKLSTGQTVPEDEPSCSSLDTKEKCNGKSAYCTWGISA